MLRSVGWNLETATPESESLKYAAPEACHLASQEFFKKVRRFYDTPRLFIIFAIARQ
jgi:hypothetical protein